MCQSRMRAIKCIYVGIGLVTVSFTVQVLVKFTNLASVNQSNKDKEGDGRYDSQSKASRQIDETLIQEKPIYPEECQSIGLHSSHKENLLKIRNYSFPGAEPYLSNLFSPSNYPSYSRARKIPVMVTALSSSHVKEALLLFDNINHVVRKRYPDIKLYLYDIGLTMEDKEKVKSMCQCTVIRFRFEDYPPHVKQLKGYAWKPIIIQLIARENPFIFWVDSSVRFKESNLEPLFTKVKQIGILATRGYNSITSRTHRQTFVALNEDPCVFCKVTQMQACFIVFYFNEFILNNFLKPWVGCALSPGCTVPFGDPYDYLECKLGKRNDMFHMCHRFDQSVMNILLYRMYDKSFGNHVMKFELYEIHRLGSNLE